MKSFKQKQEEKLARLRAERAEQVRLEEQARKEKYWQANWGEEALKSKEEQHQQILLEDAMRRAEEYENHRQGRLLKEQEAEKIRQDQADTGLGLGHERTWQLTWQSFSNHPKIINLPMSEKIRLFKIAQSKEIQPIIQPAVIGSSSETEIINYVLSFSGDRSGATDSHAITTFNPDTYSLWNGFTVSFWVRPDEEMNQKSVILGTRASSPVARFHFGLSGVGTNIGVGIGGNDITGINNPMEIGRWYNWVISYTGTQFDAGERKLRMWINTDARMTNNNSTSWGNQDEATESYTHGIYFGGRNTEGEGYTSGFACALDEVAIYNRCIDSVGTFANEVYNAGTSYDHLTNGQSGLVGYWKFNEGNGTTITDHSGNGNHGTFAPISGQTTAFPIWEKITTYE
jgi:hypothetical protein